MKSSILIALTGFSLIQLAAFGQDTNQVPPPTVLEAVEQSTGQIVVRGSALIGSVEADGAEVSVICKADVLPVTNRKEYGIAVQLRIAGAAGEDRTIIDFDELESLLGSIDYLSSINWSVTPLTGFDAAYVSKGGFRVSAFSSKRLASIQYAVRSNRMAKGILLSTDQWGRFRSLIDQAKARIDLLRKS